MTTIDGHTAGTAAVLHALNGEGALVGQALELLDDRATAQDAVVGIGTLLASFGRPLSGKVVDEEKLATLRRAAVAYRDALPDQMTTTKTAAAFLVEAVLDKDFSYSGPITEDIPTLSTPELREVAAHVAATATALWTMAGMPVDTIQATISTLHLHLLHKDEEGKR